MSAYDYRIDATSNYGNESYCEKTVLEHLTSDQATRIADILNDSVGEGSDTYYQPRHNSKSLWRGMEEFI